MTDRDAADIDPATQIALMKPSTQKLVDWIKRTPIPDPRQSPTGQAAKAGQSAIVRKSENGTLPRGERACLIAAAQHPNGVTRQQMTVLTGYKRSTRDAYIQRLRERGYADIVGERIQATDDGRAALGDAYEPLPTGAALREHVLRTLPEGERKVLEALISVYPSEAERNWIDSRTSYKRSTRDAYLGRLSARELIEFTSGMPKASATLFD